MTGQNNSFPGDHASSRLNSAALLSCWPEMASLNRTDASCLSRRLRARPCRRRRRDTATIPWTVHLYYDWRYRDQLGLFRVSREFRDLDPPPSWWRLGFDGKALLEAFVGTVVGLIALFSSDDHVNLPLRQLPLPQQWGVWLIALSLPLVFVRGVQYGAPFGRDAQLAARSRRRTAQDAARERARVARLDALRNRLDRGRLAV